MITSRYKKYKDYQAYKDHYGGALMLLIGITAAVFGARYGVGTLTDMGPGFFPVSIGVALGLIGSAIVLTAKRPASASSKEVPSGVDFRGSACIAASVVAFIVIGQHGGLLPATFAIVFISACADRASTWRTSLLIACAISAISVLVFWWALNVQFPLFQWG
jgi:hypothetical protein